MTVGDCRLGEENYLLGKFQVVAVPVAADYDAAFNSLQAGVLQHHRMTQIRELF